MPSEKRKNIRFNPDLFRSSIAGTSTGSLSTLGCQYRENAHSLGPKDHQLRIIEDPLRVIPY
jgi:hypothetical protein